MSLLKKASIITTPTAYAEDYLYSIKPAYQIGINEVANGDMELDCCWSNYSSSTVTNERSIEEVHSGSYSRKYVTSGGTGGIQSNYFTTFTGKTYNLTFWVYPSSGTVQRIAIRRGDNSDWSVDSTFSGLTQNAWNKCTFTYTEAVGGATAYIAFHSSGATGTWYIDDVSINGITEADFDFDRNSTGTRVNEDYLIEDVPYNLSSYSESINNWTAIGSPTVTTNIAIAPDGTLTADGLQDTTGSAFKRIRTDISVSGNSTFTASCFIKKVSSETANTGFALVFTGTSTKVAYGIIDSVNGTMVTQSSTITPTFKVESANNDYWRFSMTATDTGNNTSLEFAIYGTLSSDGTSVSTGAGSLRTIWGAQLVKGDQPKDYLKTTDRLDIPRIDYTNGEPSILLEPQRTNSNTYSENLSQWTNFIAGSVGTDLIVNPTGNTNKSYWIPDSSNTFHHIDKQVSVASGQQYTISIFLKADGSDFLNFALLNTSIGNVDGNAGPVVNIKDGTKVGFSNSDYDVDIVSYGNGWHRYAWTVTTNSTSLKLDVNPLRTSSISSYNGNGSNGIYVYGLQLELGSYATSLIHTSGSAVTRSQDSANNAGNSDLINSTEGVLYAEIASLTTLNDDERTISLSDGTNINTVRLQFNTLTNNIRVFVGNGSTQANMNTTISDITDFNKLAFKYKANDFALWINGVEVLTDTSGTTFSSGTLNKLGFVRGDNSEYFYGNFKSVMVFKEALTDLELEKLTGYNNHELYMNYYNRLSYLGLAEEYNVESDINNYIL